MPSILTELPTPTIEKPKKEIDSSIRCNCPSCKKDNILNGTLTENCGYCQSVLNATTPFNIMGDKSLVCERCVNEYYTNCTNCGKLHKKVDIKKVKTHSNMECNVCSRCYVQYYKECNICHNHFERDYIHNHGDKTFCRPCFEKSYHQCSYCSAVHPVTSSFHIIRTTHKVCDNCYKYCGQINTYEAKPKLEFQGKPPHYYGVELECELENGEKLQRGAKADEVLKLLGDNFAVLKEDGSLRCGFEICTQPASKEEHLIRWDNFFNNLPKNLVSFNSASANCGLHIHCSKKPLSLLTIAKVVVFVNDEKNKSFIETIAGRSSNNYFQLSKMKHSTVTRIPKKQLSRSNRYEAVNLVNTDTIEFRMFKGTLKRESFFKAIEFCDAIIHFCMMGNYGINYCRKMNNFVEYVNLQAKEYPHLHAFICAKIKKVETKLTKQFGFSVPGATQIINETNLPAGAVYVPYNMTGNGDSLMPPINTPISNLINSTDNQI